MKLTKALLLFLIFQNLASIAFSQQNLVYNHYFLNPYLYNPSYIAKDGYTELFVNYKKYWSGFSGAPQTTTVNFQMPLSYKAGFGINLYNDQAGIFQTNTGMLSFAYQIYLGESLDEIHKIGFGISVGATNTRVDFEKASNFDDPAFNNASTSSFDGQFGLNYQYNNLRIGLALPRLVKTTLVSENSFNSPGLEPLQSTIATISYNFNLSSRIAFEPFFLYRTEKDAPSQFEGLGVIKIDNLAWIGGAYRQDYGASAFLGLNVKQWVKVGYAYEFAPNQVNGIGKGGHEVQLIIRLSKRKKERSQPVKQEQKVEEQEEQVEAKEETEIQQEIDTIAQQKAKEPIIAETVEPEPKIESETNPVQKTEVPEVAPQQLNDSEKHIAKTLDGNALAPGHYVVVGAFESVVNAKNYKNTLKRSGYPADVAFNPGRGYYIVHMGVTSTIEEAKTLRDGYRKRSRYSFRDTWILTIE